MRSSLTKYLLTALISILYCSVAVAAPAGTIQVGFPLTQLPLVDTVAGLREGPRALCPLFCFQLANNQVSRNSISRFSFLTRLIAFSNARFFIVNRSATAITRIGTSCSSPATLRL
jgi:hypothetical protein